MLRSATEMLGFTLSAQDGRIGRCSDLLFDDLDWAVRYAVVDASGSVPETTVLVSHLFLGEPDWSNQVLPVRLTREKIEQGPVLEEHSPISRTKEIEYYNHFGLPYYWNSSDLGETYPTPESFGGAAIGETPEEDAPPSTPEDARLRSINEVLGYFVGALDAEIGRVDDLIVSEDDWSIRYLVVDTRERLSGKRVLISSDWVTSVLWAERRVRVSLHADTVRSSPEYDPRAAIDGAFESRLHDHYGRPS